MAKYPTLFTTNFDANKKAVDKVAIIRNRALRNQIAGAITKMVSEEAPASNPGEMATELEDLITAEEPSVDEQGASPQEVSQQAQ